MIQFARAVGLEVSLASFGMLEDLLLKANLVGRGGGGGRTSSTSAFSSCAGTSIGDSVASRSVYSLPTISESAQSEEVAMGSRDHVRVVRLTRRCLACQFYMIKVGLIA